jgi:hypothetical protein
MKGKFKLLKPILISSIISLVVFMFWLIDRKLSGE